MMKKVVNDNQCVTVLQIGSRHRYALPRIFSSASLLGQFFTDSCTESFIGKISSALSRNFKGGRIARLGNRSPQGVPREKIVATDIPVLLDAVLPKAGTDPLKLLERTLKIARITSRVAIRKMPVAPKIVYTLSREFQDYVSWAKSNGSKSIVDIFINPKTSWIMKEHTGSGDPTYTKEFLEAEFKSYEKSISMADIVLCPSDFVSRGVMEMFPDAESKIRIVPYGSSIPARDDTGTPILGRFLFVGRDLKRKGADLIHEALGEVRARYPLVEVCFAGANESDLLNAGLFGPGMVALGNLGEEELNREYLKADAFVLPSRSEGFASVITEACSFGLPLIISKECGAPVINGENALLVSSSDPKDLSHAMLSILDDRLRRKFLAAGSSKLALLFTEAAWSERLVKVINELL